MSLIFTDEEVEATEIESLTHGHTFYLRLPDSRFSYFYIITIFNISVILSFSPNFMNLTVKLIHLTFRYTVYTIWV